MKRTIIAVITLMLVIVLCVASAWFLSSRFRALDTALTEMETAYREKRFSEGIAIADQTVADFEKTLDLFPFFLSHNNVHSLSESLKRIPVLMQYGDDSAFLTEILHCRMLMEEMRDTERVLSENIF